LTRQLEVDDLHVRLETDEGPLLAVNGLTFGVDAGEILAVVGESGCGKSMAAMALMGLLPSNARKSGHIYLQGRDITRLRPARMRALRGKELSMVFQEPMTSLNPAFTIGFQIIEVLRRHEGIGRKAARQRAAALLEQVGIPAPEQRLDEYAHQLSGGMRKRVMIAMAVACNPKVIIADEPTTALDVTIQAQILDIIRGLRSQSGTAVILITHNLGVVADIADQVAVMYAGHLIETGPVHKIFAAPQHPYTMGLLAAVPRADQHPQGSSARLREIPGLVPVLRDKPRACVFAPRCPRVANRCWQAQPMLKPISDTQSAACFYPGTEAPDT
jgi:oligopeptide/dipeptide ABC transporter ATP-binding protein